MSEPAGPFKVVLHSVDDMWKNSRVRSEVSRLFQIDDETASNIVSAIPIVVIDGLDARTAGIVRERLRSLAEGGCRVVTTDDPADTIPRVNWPEPPEIARVPAEELRAAGEPGRAAAPDYGPPLLTFSCPGCGHAYHLMRAAPGTVAVVPPVAHGQVGALVKPGVGAPSGGKPGTNGDAGAHTHVAVQAQSHTVHAAPAPEAKPAHVERGAGKENGRARHQADEPGPKLAGDDWMDPPITASPLKSPAKAPAPTPAPAPAKAKAPEPAPAPPPPAPLPTPAASSPRPQPATSRLASGPAGTGSLLDDPLLAARSFESASNTMSGNGEPGTFTAKPITSRFSRNVVPQPVSAQAAPVPAARAQPAPVPAPAPAAAAPAPRAQTTRFPAPPPPPKSAAPPPPPPRSAAAAVSSSALDEELDVHFDEASDLEAVEKLPPEPDEEQRPPSGVEEDSGSLLDSEDLDMISSDPLAEVKSSGARARAARTEAPPARRGAPSKKLDDDDDDDDALLFDEDSSRGKKKEPIEQAPAKAPAKAQARKESLESSNIDDLLDEPPQASVSRKPQSVEASRRGQGAPAARRGSGEESSRRGREPVPIADSEESELLLDDEPSTRKGVPKPKGRSTLDSDDDDSLFGSDERPPAKGRGAPPGRKSKAPSEDDFEGALDMFADGDENPLDDGRGLDAAASPEDVPEIQPLDLASDVGGGPSKNSPAKSGKRKAAESPFDKPSSSAILEPLDPNEAMAILKTHTQEDGDPGASTSGDDPPGPSGDLEPLDPNEALAILGTPEDRPRAGKTPPRVKPRQKNGRSSDPSKLVPLSASDEDFAFLEGNKAKAKKTDPFARARGGDDRGSSAKKRPDDQPKGRAADTEAAPSPSPAKSRSKPEGRNERSAPPPPAKSAAGGSRRPPAGVAEGTGECGLVLPRISTDDKRQKAAELISEIKGVSVDDALKLTERTIIPVLTGVSREVAEFHREKFERNKISARVTTRQKEK
jgi:hypothetical protein